MKTESAFIYVGTIVYLGFLVVVIIDLDYYLASYTFVVIVVLLICYSLIATFDLIATFE